MAKDVEFLMRCYHAAINSGASEADAMYWAIYWAERWAVAKSQNAHFATPISPGRPAILTDAQKEQARRMYASGSSMSDIARQFGCNKSTISRLFSKRLSSVETSER